jgi:hypothetical protein
VSGLERAGETGLGGIGDYFDPFQSQVIGGVQSSFDRLRGQASKQAEQEATAAGAFGGSRSGILEAERLRGLDEAEAQQIGQLQSQGFGRAADRLMAERQRLGGLGLAGIQNLYNVGQFAGGQQFQGQLAGLQGRQGLMDYARRVQMQQQGAPFQNYQQALGLLSPTLGIGGSTQQSTTPLQGGGPLQGALGGAAAGFGFGGPIGGAIGGGLGLLGGLF